MSKKKTKIVVKEPAEEEKEVINKDIIPEKQMKQANIEWLEAHKHIWEYFRADGVIRNGFDFKEAYRIAREEFDDKAIFCTWCPEDMGNLMRYVYTQYEKYVGK